MPMSSKELERIYRRTYRRLTIGISIIYAVALLAGLSVVFGNPRIAGWVSQSVQAEFVGPDVPSKPEPMRLAQPAKPMRTVKSD
jgi:hypothetical protein